jgi:hypothetical protein
MNRDEAAGLSAGGFCIWFGFALKQNQQQLPKKSQLKPQVKNLPNYAGYYKVRHEDIVISEQGIIHYLLVGKRGQKTALLI